MATMRKTYSIGQTYKDVHMQHPDNLIHFIDSLISDNAIRDADGWHLDIDTLSHSETRQLETLNQSYCSLQEIIDDRCNELYRYWIANQGFDE